MPRNAEIFQFTSWVESVRKNSFLAWKLLFLVDSFLTEMNL